MPKPGELTVALVEVLKIHMKARGVSGAQMARASKMSQPSIVRLLAGGMRPDVDEWERLAAAVGADFDDLLAEARQLRRHVS